MGQLRNQIRNKNFMERNKNESTRVQNLWDAVIAFLRRKFIAIQVYLKKQEKSQINNLTLHVKELETTTTTITTNEA